jgi:hypothetical protein
MANSTVCRPLSLEALPSSPTKEDAMHTLTISIQGAANDSASVELPDDQALPVYVKLREVVAGTRAARRSTRKDTGGASADAPNGDTPKAATTDVADLDR